MLRMIGPVAAASASVAAASAQVAAGAQTMNGRSSRAGLLAIALLAGCDSSAPSSPQAGSEPDTVAGKWDAKDACASLGRDAAASAGGAAVTDAKLEKMSQGGGGLAVTSMCTFSYANGATLIVVAREAPDPDSTVAAIENARTGGGLTPPSDAVPGLGKAAFWGAQQEQVQLFLDDTRYVAINFYNLPAGDDVKARSLSVAKALL